MPDDARGPQVAPNEDLYRLITTKDWWPAGVGRPSSAAFAHQKFSVNVASLTTLAETVRQMRDDLGVPHGGVVSFNCGFARGIGFDTCLERDERFPNNAAHAHVYCDDSQGSSRKTCVRQTR